MNTRSGNSGFLRGSVFAYILVALVLLGVLFYFFCPDSAPESITAPPVVPAPGPASQGAAEQSTNHSEPRTFELLIEQNKLVSDTRVIRVNQGDEVILNVVADSRDEFHLHGYDLLFPLSPGKRATLRFTADRAGRFEYELERSHVELGALEVHPR